MQQDSGNLFTRDDTFFGVCQGLGEDLGVNPIFLRMALPVPLFFFPVETIAGYFAAGLLVLTTRLLVPVPRAKTEPQPVEEVVPAEAVESLPIAA